MIDRQTIIELARKAGYSTQYNLNYGSEWVQHIWGGPSETQKTIKFAELVAEYTIQQMEKQQ